MTRFAPKAEAIRTARLLEAQADYKGAVRDVLAALSPEDRTAVYQATARYVAACVRVGLQHRDASRLGRSIEALDDLMRGVKR